MKISTILLLLFLASSTFADDMFPPKNWVEKPNPIASPDAQPGGEIVIFTGQSPKSLNYYLDLSVQASQIFGALYETLLTTHPITIENEPYLAEKWSISKDKKTFTFYIKKHARWSDGKPITAQDVQWTYKTIKNPKNLTGPHKIDLERFHEPVVLDTHTIRFIAKSVHWKNLIAIGGFLILP